MGADLGTEKTRSLEQLLVIVEGNDGSKRRRTISSREAGESERHVE